VAAVKARLASVARVGVKRILHIVPNFPDVTAAAWSHRALNSGCADNRHQEQIDQRTDERPDQDDPHQALPGASNGVTGYYTEVRP